MVTKRWNYWLLSFFAQMLIFLDFNHNSTKRLSSFFLVTWVRAKMREWAWPTFLQCTIPLFFYYFSLSSRCLSPPPVAVEIRRLWGDMGVDPRACEDLLLVRQPLSQLTNKHNMQWSMSILHVRNILSWLCAAFSGSVDVGKSKYSLPENISQGSITKNMFLLSFQVMITNKYCSTVIESTVVAIINALLSGMNLWTITLF